MVQTGMNDFEHRQELCVRDAFAGGGFFLFRNGGKTPTLPGGLVNLCPRSRCAVTDVIDLSGGPMLQRNEADHGQVFNVNQIDVFARRANAAAFNPADGIAAWTIDAGHAQYDRATAGSQELFALHAGLVQIDRRRFIDPGWGIFS